jgi:hypothetical protein
MTVIILCKTPRFPQDFAHEQKVWQEFEHHTDAFILIEIQFSYELSVLHKNGVSWPLALPFGKHILIRLPQLALFYFLLLYWGYIVTFTKVFYNISWLNSPLHHSSVFPLPHSWKSFNRSHFSIYIQVNIVFPPYLPCSWF